ncbi:MAG: hypothetical protein ACOCX5_04265 [Chloroflexota bacterium]
MLLWLIAGFLLGAGALYMYRHPDVKVAWFDWAMLALAVVFFSLAIINYNGSMDELEPRAASFLLVSFGLPGLILAAIAGVRIWRNSQTATAPAATSSPPPPAEAETSTS